MAQNTYHFELKTPDSLIDVECHFKDENFRFALDTGASHTVIDLAALIVAGYDMVDVVRTVQLETGNGSVEGYGFSILNSPPTKPLCEAFFVLGDTDIILRSTNDG